MQNTTKKLVLRGFAEVVRAHRVWFLAFAGAALILRFLFVFRFLMYTPDSLVYGDFAKTWIQHHMYGMSSPGGPIPADFRLPGYPAYLALCFLIAGIDHYGAACVGQVFVDLGTCFLVAALALRIAGERAAKWAFALTALCPFLANYAGTALTETWSIFFTALALLLATYGSNALPNVQAPLRSWAWCGLAIGASVLLRPDGGMLLVALLLWLAWRFSRAPAKARIFKAALLVGTFTFVPLAPWTVRNAITLHEFQPLPSVTAAGTGEFFPGGFYRWMRTWTVDYASLEDIGFRVDGEEIPFNRVPNRAFDTPGQRQRTEELFTAYNQTAEMTPELDAQFAELARARIRRNPLRYYVELPALCALDMWLRPRTEMLPVDIHWWEFHVDPYDSGISVAIAVLNLALLATAAWSLRNARSMPYLGMLLTFVVVRTMLLPVFTPPEPRYVLECFPVVLALAGAVASRRSPVAEKASW